MQEVQSTCTCIQRELSKSCTHELHMVIMSHAITSQHSLSKMDELVSFLETKPSTNKCTGNILGGKMATCIPATLVLFPQYWGGYKHLRPPHLQFWGDRPPLSPPRYPPLYMCIFSYTNLNLNI